MIKKSYSKEILKIYDEFSKEEMKNFLLENNYFPEDIKQFKSNQEMQEALKEYQEKKRNSKTTKENNLDFCDVCECSPCDCDWGNK
jgi:DNA gyrase/topoisomerase IV subunit B